MAKSACCFYESLETFAKWFWKKKEKTVLFTRLFAFLMPYVKPIIPPEAGNLPSTSSTENAEIINATKDVSNDVTTESEQSTERCDVDPTPPSTHDNSAQNVSNTKRKKSSLHETDKHFIYYLKQKSTRINESQTSTDAVTSFLNSVASELREMNLQ